MEELNSNMDHFQPDPLLKPGAFIDPNPPSNGAPELKPFAAVDRDPPSGRKSNGKAKRGPASSAVNPTAAAVDESQPSDQKGRTTTVLPTPDWLPPGWTLEERVRASGASAGSRDKYYVCPVTKRNFRSKKEVLYYLETGSTKKRKNVDSDADSTPAAAADSAAKRKKSESKVKKSLKKFNFDDVPASVKWMLSDVYEGTWRPLMNGVDRVPESAKQDWTTAYTYLTLQNSGGSTEFL